MQTPEDRITEKFNELVERYGSDYESGKFSRAERAVWLIVLIGLDIDMCGFACLFEQSLTKSEMSEAIEFMKELGLLNEAKVCQTSLDALDQHGFYGDGDRPAVGFQEIPHHVWDSIREIGKAFWKDNPFKYVDEKLCAMLDEE